MSRFILKRFVFFLAVNLWNIGFFEPVASDFGGEITIAEANHRGGDRGGDGGGNCRRRRCQPPTVSELPIQYMVLSGAAVIALCGGMAFYIRKRKMKNSLEA